MGIVEIAAAATALAAIVGMAVTMAKLGKMAGVMETTLTQQNVSIGKVERKVDDLSSVITKLAVTQEQMNSLSAHIVRIDKQVQLMARGEGFVFPLGSHFPPKTKLGG